MAHVGQWTKGKWFFPDVPATRVGAGPTAGLLGPHSPGPLLSSRFLFVQGHSALTEFLKSWEFSQTRVTGQGTGVSSLITVYKSQRLAFRLKRKRRSWLSGVSLQHPQELATPGPALFWVSRTRGSPCTKKQTLVGPGATADRPLDLVLVARRVLTLAESVSPLGPLFPICEVGPGLVRLTYWERTAGEHQAPPRGRGRTGLGAEDTPRPGLPSLEQVNQLTWG